MTTKCHWRRGREMDSALHARSSPGLPQEQARRRRERTESGLRRGVALAGANDPGVYIPSRSFDDLDSRDVATSWPPMAATGLATHNASAQPVRDRGRTRRSGSMA